MSCQIEADEEPVSIVLSNVVYYTCPLTFVQY
jgi:hypothetical protein